MGIEIIKLPNALKKKMGIKVSESTDSGRIDSDAIAEADRLIDDLCKDCTNSIDQFLKVLVKNWADVQDAAQGEERDLLSQELFIQAHEIKDIAAMCGFALISDFAESLRDYIDETELSVEAQRVIIQAHIDAIAVAHKKGLKEDGGPAADELKALIKVAIDKYS